MVKITNLFIALAFFIFVVSCKEEDTPTTSNKKVVKPTVNNVGNPMNYIGLLHNDGLKYYFENNYDSNIVRPIYNNQIFYTMFDFNLCMQSAKSFLLTKGYSNSELILAEHKSINYLLHLGFLILSIVSQLLKIFILI